MNRFANDDPSFGYDVFIPKLEPRQCDRIGRLIALWATFQSFPKLPTVVGNFCKGEKIHHFSSEIIIGQIFQQFGNILLVTLNLDKASLDKETHESTQ